MRKCIPFFLACLLQSCGFSETACVPEREVVLHPGMKISLRDPKSGNELQIECKKPTKRDLTMNGSTRTVKVQNRSERWYGNYGVYTKSRWHLLDLIRLQSHVSYQEGIQHFCSLEEAMMWIKRANSYATVYYNDEGILISIRKNEERHMWNIDLWRICIAGDIPENLPDAKGYIELSGGDSLPKCYVLNGYQLSEPKVVGGVYFTGRVLDLMSEHDVGCDDAIEAIQKGTVKDHSQNRKSYEYGPETDYGFINPFRSIQVFTGADGRVEFIKVSRMWKKNWNEPTRQPTALDVPTGEK